MKMRRLILSLCCLWVLVSWGQEQPKPEANEIQAYSQPIEDPWEGFNRGCNVFNRGLNAAVLYPIGTTYRTLVPEMARNSISNFFDNLGYPLRLVNSCIQGKWQGSWNETKRFFINTTVGVGGLGDPATSIWSIPASREDFGKTFGHYGMGPGYYLTLPVRGPTTTRDAVGGLLGIPFSILQWLLPSPTGMIVTLSGKAAVMSEDSPSIKNFYDTNYDTYPLLRAMTVLSRETAIHPPEMSGISSDPDQALGALLFQPKENLFIDKGYEMSVRLPGADHSIHFNCWPAKDDVTENRLVVILAGLGSHRKSGMVAAFAERYRNEGWSVISFSSTFHPDFFLGVPQKRFPGDIWEDAKDLETAIQMSMQAFNERFPKKATERCSVLGYSLGALNAIALMDLNQLPVDKYIAINPPRNPMQALNKLDTYFNTMKTQWGEESELKTRELLKRVIAGYHLGEGGLANIPITREESYFLLGLYMRLPLMDTIQASAKERQMVIPGYPAKMTLQELLSISWLDYAEKAVLPEVNRRRNSQSTRDDLLKKGFSLDEVGTKMKEDPRLLVFHSKNDFLVSQEDFAWFQATMGERLILVDEGSHLGAVANPEYVKNVIQATGAPVQKK